MSRLKRVNEVPRLIRSRDRAATIVFAGIILAAGITIQAAAQDKFNKKGNIVIADQFNNRVIEIDPETHNVVWTFGDGSSTPGPNSIVGTNDAERVGQFTLISGTGIPGVAPPGAPLPGCPAPQNATIGCPDNRVIVVNAKGQIVWQYGQDGGVAGSGPDQLNVPVAATFLPNGHVLITDQSNERVIEVNLQKEVVWQYGVAGAVGIDPCANPTGVDDGGLTNPNSAELLDNGHILIADENNNRAIEVNRDTKKIINTFTARCTVSGVAFASRLANGNTLLTDSNNSRIVEVDPNDTVVWTYVTNTRMGSITAPLPTRAVRLRNGNTLVSDQFNNQVIEVDHDKNIVFTQGQIAGDFPPGNGFDQLNGPYDAKVVRDFTGLTRPPDLEDEFGDD